MTYCASQQWSAVLPLPLHISLCSSDLNFSAKCPRWHFLLTCFPFPTAKFSRKEEDCYAWCHFCNWTCSSPAGKKEVGVCLRHKLVISLSTKEVFHTLYSIFLWCICILSLKIDFCLVLHVILSLLLSTTGCEKDFVWSTGCWICLQVKYKCTFKKQSRHFSERIECFSPRTYLCNIYCIDEGRELKAL